MARKGRTEGHTKSDFELISHGPEQTRQMGSNIGELAQAGDVILLVGELGTGKTCLAQGIAWGLGLVDHIPSPSFVLVREHQGRLDLYHIDFYRLDEVQEIAQLGIDDYLYGQGLCVVEWADRALASLPKEHMLIKFEHRAENERWLCFEPSGKRYVKMFTELERKWNSR